MKWINWGALLSLILMCCIASAQEPVNGPQPGALLPNEAGCSSTGGLIAGSSAAPFHRPCGPELPCTAGAQLFSRPCLLCLPAGEGAQPFRRPCCLDLPCGPGAQLFSRPCPLCLPAGEGAQPFRRPCSCGLPDGTGAQLYRRPCALCLPVGLGAELFSRHCSAPSRAIEACTPP
jgi:hypothetical protein